MKILFVCTGNICRSAMAEGLARKSAKDNNLDIEIYSADCIKWWCQEFRECKDKGIPCP